MLRTLLLLFLIYSGSAVAENWIAARYAANCSGCHAPGRRNIPPKQRRCALSCQGCHVNPSGGGVRNYYGKWNENRWLRSFKLAARERASRRPSYIKKQKYNIPLKSYKKGKHKNIISKNRKQVPYELALDKTDATPEDSYLKHVDNVMYEIGNASRMEEFLYTIPKDDPYRLKRLETIDGGGDLRLSVLKSTTGTSEQKKLKRFVMNADVGIRWRPTTLDYNLVYEARLQGGPAINDFDKLVGNEKTRSLYFMWDNLPHNFYLQAGYYRPLFGHYTPDHYALAQVMTGSVLGQSPYNLLYKTLSVGAAPNVPYFNMHVILKDLSDGDSNDKTTGVVANLGMRGVTNGWNINYSLWSSTDKTDPKNDIKVLMHSLYGGIIFNQKLWFNLELLSLERDNPARDFRRGGVYTFETKYRFWREMYIQGAYAVSNTLADLSEGSATQSKLGVRTFLYSGWDLELEYTSLSQKPKGGAESERKYLLANLHVYY